MEKSCLNCGAVFVANPKAKPRIYCSTRCCQEYWYAHRSDRGCPQSRISVCQYCGAKFDNLNNRARKYCCHGHYIASRFGKVIENADSASSSCVAVTEPLSGAGQAAGGTVASVDSQYGHRNPEFSKAIELRESGLGYQRIAERLGLSPNTVKGWFRRYPDQFPRINKRRNNLVPWDADTRSEVLDEESGTELIDAGIEVHKLRNDSEGRTFLVCGLTNFRGKFDNIAAQIPHIFSDGLLCGDVFVFCSKNHHQISLLQWQGDGFALMFRRTEQERYPWPFFANPTVIEVTRTDLQMLLEYPRFTLRLRGLTTPELAA